MCWQHAGRNRCRKGRHHQAGRHGVSSPQADEVDRGDRARLQTTTGATCSGRRHSRGNRLTFDAITSRSGSRDGWGPTTLLSPGCDTSLRMPRGVGCLEPWLKGLSRYPVHIATGLRASNGRAGSRFWESAPICSRRRSHPYSAAKLREALKKYFRLSTPSHHRDFIGQDMRHRLGVAPGLHTGIVTRSIIARALATLRCGRVQPPRIKAEATDDISTALPMQSRGPGENDLISSRVSFRRCRRHRVDQSHGSRPRQNPGPSVTVPRLTTPVPLARSPKAPGCAAAAGLRRLSRSCDWKEGMSRSIMGCWSNSPV